ncbi:gsr3094 [Gloeobacter violaceus PCC 7421]|uniref:Gsr3094 protein n=1 Tax=Gloeobacter violaceus (strain ATCC 29082 / PCC 7421) TaxID=251221 RepID=Q7NC85_GLOVI|nr:gsr3094 [Gloeobacter violaceus PCC 7421]
MDGQMCWLRVSNSPDPRKILHLRMLPSQPWTPYTEWQHLMVPDYREPGGAKGWATYQKLIRVGWKVEKSTENSPREHLVRSNPSFSIADGR